jgi:hypothetical protein
MKVSNKFYLIKATGMPHAESMARRNIAEEMLQLRALQTRNSRK